jgi:xylono-1,5-lactonase
MTLRCIHPARAVLGEGALWSAAEQRLYWIDQMRPELHRFDPASGKDEQIAADLPEQLGALLPRASGGMVLAASDGISVVASDSPRRKTIVNPIATKPRASFNDAKCDRQGRLWGGTTDRQETDAIGELYRIDRDGTATLIADGFICSNGPSFSPDGRIMYHTRSHDRAVVAYDIDAATGRASNERVFARVAPEHGIPDGSTVDAEGHFWCTHWGGWRVTRFRPDGTVDRVVEMPVKSPTSCAFGGPDLKTLFITSASITMVDKRWVYMSKEQFDAAPTEGGIFALDVDVPGVPETPFAG